MDTFSHILIAFLLLGQFDLNLAVFAGVMALIIDLDVILFPLTKKYPLFEHRGLVHSILGVICVTLVASLIYSSLTGINYGLSLGAGLIGAFSHTTCDTMTNYGTLSLWPFVKKYVKLDINPGISPITTIVSTISIPFLYSAYRDSNLLLFNNIYLIVSIFFGIYFIIRISLKSYIQFKFHTKSLPNFNPFKYKLVQVSLYNEGDQEYKEIKWRTINLLTGKFTEQGQIRYPMMNPTPPLDTDEKMISFSYKTTPIQRILGHSDYHLYEILEKNEDAMIIFWYVLEFTMGKWRMGATIDLKRDGTYKTARKYPSLKNH
ncbi:MAG: metal-dependent hydrolase [Candidatus Helarchaeota archaeon]|nr:metal-dependent hydrolase [Candidatus Helarchaeota archaeon]